MCVCDSNLPAKKKIAARFLEKLTLRAITVKKNKSIFNTILM